MRIIYLDIDGVIATTPTYNAAYRAGFKLSEKTLSGVISLLDPQKIEQFNAIIEQTGAQIILSSTWRFLPLLGDLTPIELLKKAGLKGEFIGTTSMDEELISRGHEIADDVKRRGLKSDEYIILDDDQTAGERLKAIGHSSNRWIQTSADRGMNKKHAQKAIEMLLKASAN